MELRIMTRADLPGSDFPCIHPVPPTFLGTHPSPETRIEDIYANWEPDGSKTGERFEIRYQSFKNSLPPVEK